MTLTENTTIVRLNMSGIRPPQWTTDGSQIIFAQGGSIYAVRADGTSLRLIHGEDGENDLHYSPELSPDGSRMTYLKYRHEESRRGTYHWEVAVSLHSMGRLERIITDGVGHIGSPSWSPDGYRAAFLSAGEIHTVATDGSDLRSITSIEGEIPAHGGLRRVVLRHAPVLVPGRTTYRFRRHFL